MNGPIQVIPPGLLGMLQLKNAGKLPTDFGQSLTPQLDLLKWYLLANNETLGINSVSLAAGTVGINGFATGTGQIRSPAGEWWYLHEFNIRSDTIAVGQRVCVAVGAVYPSTNVQLVSRLGPPSTDRAGPDCRICAYARDVWLPPLTEIAIDVEINTGATMAYEGTGMITRLPI